LILFGRSRQGLFSRYDFSDFIFADFESKFDFKDEGERFMHRQTQATQIFTVFGSCVLEENVDSFSLRGGRPNSQDLGGTEKTELADAVLGIAHQCLQYQ
jgi:hypothetical protein